MKKRILSLFLAFVMTLSLAAPAFAADEAFLAEESAAQEDMAPAPAPAAPEDPVPMEAPALPVEEEPVPAEDYVPVAVDEPAPAVADEPMPAALEDTPATIAENSTWKGEDSFENMWKNATGTITMTAGATVTGPLVVDSGKTITVAGSDDGVYITAPSTTVFKVDGGSLTLSGSVKVYTVGGSDHVIEVTGGTLEIQDNAEVTKESGTAIYVHSSGNVNVNGGTVGKMIVQNGNATVTGGTFSNLTVKGGTVEVSGKTKIEHLDVGGGTVTYKSGTITSFTVEGGKVTVDGTATALNIKDVTDTVSLDGSGTVTTLTVDDSTSAQKVTIGNDVKFKTVTVTGGSVKDLLRDNNTTFLDGEVPATGLSGPTITATESNTLKVGSKVQLTAVKPTAKPDLVFTGKALQLIDAGDVSSLGSHGTMKYYVTDGKGFTVDWTDQVASIAATNAGEYTIKYKAVPKDDAEAYGYKASEETTLSSKVTISPATTTIALDDPYVVYGSTTDNKVTVKVEAANVVASYSGSGTVKLTLDDKTVGTESYTVEFKSSNSASVQIQLSNDNMKTLLKDSTKKLTAEFTSTDGNLAKQSGVELEVTPNKKVITPGEGWTIEVPVKNYDGTGNLVPDTVTITPAGGTLVGSDQVTVKVTSATVAPTNAGEHTNATVTVTGMSLEGNDVACYELKDGESYQFTNASVTINKVAPTVEPTPSANPTLTYNGNDQPLLATAGATTHGTIKYAVVEGAENTAATPAPEAYNADAPTKKDAGTYTVWYKVVGDANHNDTTPEKVTASIAKAKTTVTLALTSPSDVTYGENVTLTATVKADVTGAYTPNGKVTLTQGGKAVGEAKVPTGTTGSWTAEFTLTNDELKEAIKNGTEGQFKAEFADDANLEGSSGTLQLTVSPKPIQASQLTFAATDSNKVFNDNTDLDTQYYTVTIDKVYVMDDDVTIVSTGATLPDKNVGEHTSVTVNGLELGGTDAACYTLAGLSEDGNKSYTFTEGVSVTVDPFGMTFAPDQWTWPYGDPGTVNPQQTDGESPRIDAGNIKVTYKYKPESGAEQDLGEDVPAGPGVYTVCASVTDRNFKLKSGAASDEVGTLTITHVHVWSDKWVTSEKDPTHHWHPCIGPGECDMTDPSAIPGNANGYTGHPWPADAPYGWITDEDDECSHRICPDCGYEEDSRHQAAEPKVWQSEGPDGQHFLTCEKCTLPFDHEAHKWVADPEQEGVYKCSVCGEILEEADGGFPVSGKVTDSAGKGVMDAKVTLTSSDGETVTLTYMSDDGESELTADHVMTDHSGSFSFPDVVPGAYTLTVTTKDEKITVTKLVEVSSDGTVSDANVRLPRGDVSIQVDVDVHTYVTGDSDIPAVIVDGLLEAVTSDEDVIGSQKVEIEMSVTAQEESAFTEPDDKQAVEDIKDLAGGQGKNLSYLDVTILKTVNDGEPKELTETNSIITLVVPYEFSGRNNVTVYRYHDGAAAKLDKLTDKTKTANAFYLDSANGLIYIYANQFSVYAIGYTTPTYYPPLTIADKTALNAAIAAAEALNPEDYTAESWSALETALAAAKEAADFTWAAQEDVDAAAAALQKAIDALVKLVPAVDKSALEAAIAEAGALDPEDYTEETWAGVADALEAAKDVAADETATQEQVDDARKALDAAVGALAPAEVPEVDKGGLETAIDAAEALDPEDYTEESWAAVQEALEAAKDVAADESATQEDVDAAQKALDAAVGALVPAGEPEVDKSMLEQLIATAETVNEADCTPESWAFMAEALEVAKAIYADPDAPQEDVDAAVLVLFGAIMALEPAEPGIEPPAAPSSGTGWMENESGIYFYKDGELKKSYWVGKTDGASQWDGNWYYVDANGKLLTGMQYLDDLHGGMGWYFLQPTNANGEIGKMLTGWQWVGGEYGTGWFSQTEGSAGKCTYTTELGDWTGSAWVK